MPRLTKKLKRVYASNIIRKLNEIFTLCIFLSINIEKCSKECEVLFKPRFVPGFIGEGML